MKAPCAHELEGVVLNGKSNLIIVLIILAVLVGALNYYKISAYEGRVEKKVENAREVAGLLASEKLYSEAAAYIESYLKQQYPSPSELEPTMMYLADLYMDNINDYEKAMANYLKLLHKFPDTKYKNDVQRRIIECKSRLGRRLEAMHDLENYKAKNSPGASSTKSSATSENEVVVAKIGSEKITMREYLGSLDETLKGAGVDVADVEQRIKLLKTIIVKKVLKKIAISNRFDSDREILKIVENEKERLMIEKLLERDVTSKVEVDEMAMKLYYDAHKNQMRTEDRYKFEYVEISNETEAASISSTADSKRFASLSPRETPFSNLMEISGRLSANLFEATSEISAAAQGEIVKKYIASSAGNFIVLRLMNLIKGEIIPFEKVKDEIRRALTAQKREDEVQNYIMKNFAEMNVVIYEDVFLRESAKDTSEAKIK